MKYLLIAVFVFIVGCSNLTEEKVYVLNKTSLDQEFTVKFKYFDDKLNWKFKVEQKKNCNRFKNIKFWRIYFTDNDDYTITQADIYSHQYFRIENDCLGSASGIAFMNPEKYRLISDVDVRAAVIE